MTYDIGNNTFRKTKIIGEAGVNHNGSEELALKLVDTAKKSDLDIVKFQVFNAGSVVAAGAGKATYQSRIIGAEEPQLAMLKKLELSYDSHLTIFKYCESQGLEYLSTAFDPESLEFLVTELNLQTLKIPSGEITNAPFLLQHARAGRNLLVSTGMATLAEIENALSVLAFGLLDTDEKPSTDAFKAAYCSSVGQKVLRDKVILLHCTTEYPAPFREINISAISTLKSAFGLEVGYSDHSVGNVASIGAVVLGARVLEKHFTLDKTMAGPDHLASMNPSELNEFVRDVRICEETIGSGIKHPTPSEIENITASRRSLVASQKVGKGDVLDESNISIKRPSGGVSPFEYWNYIGQVSSRDYKKDDLL